MTVLHINSDQPVDPGMLRQAASLPDGAPTVIMVHGYRFSPDHPRYDPHRHILALDPDVAHRRILSWPRALGFDNTTAPDQGLAIAFGWRARGTLRGAYHRAGLAGWQLAQLIATISAPAKRQIALIGHSLGARVILSALPHIPGKMVGRIILLAGAEFRNAAAAALDSPAGQTAEVLNITSRENDIFDFGLELFVAAARQQALGLGLREPHPNWIDIQLDDLETLRMLASLGFPMNSQAARMSHWSPYLREGVFDFYRTALFQPWALPLNLLRRRLPGAIQPRWSRLLAAPVLTGGLRA